MSYDVCSSLGYRYIAIVRIGAVKRYAVIVIGIALVLLIAHHRASWLFGRSQSCHSKLKGGQADVLMLSPSSVLGLGSFLSEISSP